MRGRNLLDGMASASHGKGSNSDMPFAKRSRQVTKSRGNRIEAGEEGGKDGEKEGGADLAATGMLNAITSETTARMAAADLFEAGAVIRDKVEAAESRARTAKLADEMLISRREKDMNAIITASSSKDTGLPGLQLVLFKRAGLSEEEINMIHGHPSHDGDDQRDTL